jgi:single-strand selective monofunctional uracil DNA glycosylase
MSDANEVVSTARLLGQSMHQLRFDAPVAQVYNPLDYAFEAHRAYLVKYFNPEANVVLLGMNPGPWGMVQTGVPFGEVTLVRDWLGIDSGVTPPGNQHPKRPIQGFACGRSEVSGQRLWGWARDRFVTPASFFRRFFVWNYCPLAFMEASGRNRTPDKLPAAERESLYEICNGALGRLVELLEPEQVLGVGKFGEQRARAVLGQKVPVGSILHPSPASPAANRGWAQQVEKQLAALGIDLQD